MSETIEKNQDAKNILAEKPDDSTWDVTVTRVRQELSKCLDELPLKPHDPNLMLEISNRLKSLACMLDKLVSVYAELSKLPDSGSLKQDKS